ncbi:hypothetical protein E2C01_033968 [Portunus trituberculatus]|uniref:Uncharacterized protein n=1 Tax=Portunus trituberculatus TaxID=210409 RepID=A0A5B7F090_PORTR|nr:hypothetical protein [Portunus trituberculatus]
MCCINAPYSSELDYNRMDVRKCAPPQGEFLCRENITMNAATVTSCKWSTFFTRTSRGASGAGLLSDLRDVSALSVTVSLRIAWRVKMEGLCVLVLEFCDTFSAVVVYRCECLCDSRLLAWLRGVCVSVCVEVTGGRLLIYTSIDVRVWMPGASDTDTRHRHTTRHAYESIHRVSVTKGRREDNRRCVGATCDTCCGGDTWEAAEA